MSRQSDYNRRRNKKDGFKRPVKINFGISPKMLSRLNSELTDERVKNSIKKLPDDKPADKSSNHSSDKLFYDPTINSRKSISDKVKDKPIPPKNVNEYWGSFKSEMRLRWPKAEFPSDLSKIDARQLKLKVSVYKPYQVLEMIRILVWDWETVRNSCFPYMPNRPRPTIENLWKHSNDLFAAIGIGVTDNREGRLSKYKKRYINNENPSNLKESSSSKLSMLERFRQNNKKSGDDTI